MYQSQAVEDNVMSVMSVMSVTLKNGRTPSLITQIVRIFICSLMYLCHFARNMSEKHDTTLIRRLTLAETGLISHMNTWQTERER